MNKRWKTKDRLICWKMSISTIFESSGSEYIRVVGGAVDEELDQWKYSFSIDENEILDKKGAQEITSGKTSNYCVVQNRSLFTAPGLLLQEKHIYCHMMCRNVFGTLLCIYRHRATFKHGFELPHGVQKSSKETHALNVETKFQLQAVSSYILFSSTLQVMQSVCKGEPSTLCSLFLI